MPYNKSNNNKFSRGNNNFKDRFDIDKSERYKEVSALSTKPEQSQGTYRGAVASEYKQAVSPIIVKADPYDKGTIIGDPYSITNKPNKVIDVTYPGVQNTQGNTLPQLRSRLDSGNKLMKRFDSAKLHLSLNYLHLAMTGSETNVNNNYQMEESFEEALSILSSEVLTQINGLNYKYNPAVGSTTFPHKSTGNALFSASILYQTILQNLNAVIIGYNKLLANEKAMLDMSFNTTTTQVIELFNLLKKGTFSGTLKAVSDMILGEYFDLNWAKQVNILQVGLSHKSQSFTDPNLELFGTHRMPVVDIGVGESTAYESVVKTNDFKVTSTIDGVTAERTLAELVRLFLEKVSLTSILKWARSVVFDNNTETAKSYFNQIQYTLESIRAALGSFKAKFSGIRTVFDVLSKSGMMYWDKSVSARVVSRPGTVVDPVRNRLIEDIYKSLVGVKTINLDTNSYRFRYFAIYDKFDGIAKFDDISGGSFIQFSSKQVTGLPTGDRNPIRLIPVMYIADNYIKVVNRLGEEVTIDIIDMPTLADTTTWPVEKLNPLDQTIDIKIAKFDIPQLNFDKHKASHLQDFVMDVFGIGILLKSGDINAYQFIVKPSYLFYIDIEVASQSEAMLDYCRTYSPFRLQSPNEARTIGFSVGGFSNEKNN